MDSVHQPDVKQFVGPRINIREYFKNYAQLVADVNENCSKPRQKVNDAGILNMMRGKKATKGPLDPVLFEEIKKVCDPANLSEPGEVPICQISDCQIAEDGEMGEAVLPRYTSAGIPKAGKDSLSCLLLQQEFLDKATSYDKDKRMRAARLNSLTWFETAPNKPGTLRKGAIGNEVFFLFFFFLSNVRFLPKTFPNGEIYSKFDFFQVLIVMRIYKPTTKRITTMEGTLGAYNNLSLARFTQELHVLGSNTLEQLRDVIRCHHDHMIPGDKSKDAILNDEADSLTSITKESLGHKFVPTKKDDSERDRTTGEIYRSGFFYIEGCFYNDMRHPDNIDYSQVIRSWAEENPKRCIGPFTTSQMSGVRFEDLEVRFGYPYVYVHQGEHEHLFSFVEARLLCADDPQKSTDYPLERGVLGQRSKFCMVCSTTVASWVTQGNLRLPENPYFFCDECFREFNYDRDGNKIGEFKAFLYTDVNAI